MRFLYDVLGLKEEKFDIKLVVLMMLLAYAFAVVARLAWVDMFNEAPNFYWNDQIMINTNDGYWYAEGARDIIAGTHQDNDLSPVTSPLSILTAYIVKLTHIKLETVILYMPAVFGSLLAIPVFLLGAAFRQYTIGFIAALIAPIAWSYYNRTMTGYYDTDLLIVVLPTFFITSLIWSIQRKSYIAMLFVPIFAIYGAMWHTGGWHIANGSFYLLLAYTLFFDRREKFNYKLLSLIAVSILAADIYVKLALAVVLWGIFFKLKEQMQEKVLYVIFALVAVLFFALGGYGWFASVLQSAYFVRALVADEINNSFKYYEVVNTVREAGQIPFETFAARISGNEIALFFSTIGYVLLSMRYRVFLLALPMVALGFFAVQGGLRFTVFAVPFVSLGAGYLLYLLGDKAGGLLKPIVLLVGSAALLFPNVKHIKEYRVPIVFEKNEVTVLDRLKSIADREDYVIAWWDYGYPIRYYSDVKTIIDGAKHSGSQNYTVSFALAFPNEEAAANMMRLDAEFTEKSFTKNYLSFEGMLQEYKYSVPDDFIAAISNPDFKLPEKTRDVYLYLPYRMMEIYPTVQIFSAVDPLSGQVRKQPFFYYADKYQDAGNVIDLGGGIRLLKDKNAVQIGQNIVPLNSFFLTRYDNQGQLHVQKQTINPNSPVSVIFLQSYRAFLVVDNETLNSPYIRMFVLEQYNHDYFEPVILTPLAKVFKLKK